ncbi:MAG TPA: tetratricopeptide repeat protein, partial [Nitrospinaceae bacterium]|nr:tetratricopeptide repeat protein [Nitrospinaceae bacterium]
RLKKHDLAADMYQQVVQVEPANPLGYHYLARMNILSGKLEEAKNHLGQTLELRPNLLRTREFLAWVWEKLGNATEAAREYKILLKLDPLNKKIHERITGMRDSMTPVDVGTSQYRLAAEDLLDKPKVHMRIGAVYYEQAVYLKALDEFQLIRARKQTKEVLMVLGRVYEILGRVDKAIEEMDILLELEPESVNLMIYSARFYSMNEQPEETIRLLEKAITLEPKNDTLYHSLALAYMSVDKLDEAIIKIEKAISLNEQKDSYYFELGALLERTGRFERAIHNMKRSIELNPMHSNAHNFLGYMYAIQGKSLDKAIGHLNKALSIQPRNGYFLDSLSWIYFKKGESQRALDELKKAMVYTAPDPVLYSHLGDIHFSLKNYSEAGKAWKTSLFLTRGKINDTSGELPDLKDLEQKIREAREFLNKN